AWRAVAMLAVVSLVGCGGSHELNRAREDADALRAENAALKAKVSALDGLCFALPKPFRGASQEDSPLWRVRRLEGGPLHELGLGPLSEGETLAIPMGRSILRRGAQGELFAVDDSGRRTEWVPASCQGRLVNSDAERQLVLVACTSAGTDAPAPLELHGASVHQSLGIGMRVSPYHSELSQWRYPAPRLMEVRLDPSTPNTFLLDLDQRTVHPVTQNVVETRGPLALLTEKLPRDASRKRRTRLTLLNVATGAQTVLPEPQGQSVHRAGSLILYAGVLIDMESGRVLGEISEADRAVLALDPTGSVLRGSTAPEGTSARSTDVWGPVSWEPLPQ
ncbi:MAG TPA: hypothetical protein VNA24_23970, partial [Hyalangium sp.]|nr:hypothetical protein [Hyalangium sp.]